METKLVENLILSSEVGSREELRFLILFQLRIRIVNRMRAQSIMYIY